MSPPSSFLRRMWPLRRRTWRLLRSAVPWPTLLALLLVVAAAATAMWGWKKEERVRQLEEDPRAGSVPVQRAKENSTGRKSRYITFHDDKNVYASLPKFANARSILNSHGWEEVSDPKGDFALLWAWAGPLRTWGQIIRAKKRKGPLPLISYIPGLRFIQKDRLSTSGLPFVPRSFSLPQGLQELREYVSAKPNATFIFKRKGHGGIRFADAGFLQTGVSNVSALFLQEFISNPLLVGGHKFDIGVYVVIASLKPLRIYVADEVQARFCWERYHPFNASNTDKYVVSSRHKSVWEIEGVGDNMYPDYGRKEIVGSQIRSLGHDPRMTWRKMESIVGKVVLRDRMAALDRLKQFGSSENFFHLLRIDFLLDDKLQVFLLEANHGPFIESHSGELQKLHKLVIEATFRLKGIIGANDESTGRFEESIYVYPEVCSGRNCTDGDCHQEPCYLCKACLSEHDKKFLMTARKEHLRSVGLMHRVYPPSTYDEGEETDDDELSLLREDRLLRDWFKAMCRDNRIWCQ